ncbi:MAG: hypothetical protein CMM69_06610 [Rhodospirillaceae bacterium]|nr:hypothetical protein [Rhodospirillaceae bacterium]OUX28370.1 MAG: hypothetical protein CBE16_07050 [Rhodospirillaceae bacterium TMED256]
MLRREYLDVRAFAPVLINLVRPHPHRKLIQSIVENIQPLALVPTGYWKNFLEGLGLLVKSLRYATDFFEGLCSANPGKKYVRRLRRLQEELGRLNDIVTLNSTLERTLERSGGAKAQRAVNF